MASVARGAWTPLTRRGLATIRATRAAAEVLVRELVNETVGSIVGLMRTERIVTVLRRSRRGIGFAIEIGLNVRVLLSL